MEQLIEAYVRYLKAERNLSSYTIRNYRGDLCHFGRYLERRSKEPEYTFRKHLRSIGGAIEE